MYTSIPEGSSPSSLPRSSPTRSSDVVLASCVSRGARKLDFSGKSINIVFEILANDCQFFLKKKSPHWLCLPGMVHVAGFTECQLTMSGLVTEEVS